MLGFFISNIAEVLDLNFVNVYTVPHNHKKVRRDSSTGRAIAFPPLPQRAIDIGSNPVFGLFSRATKRQTYFPLPLTQTELF